jgi:ribosomal protein L3 glutamine methyltransferase
VPAIILKTLKDFLQWASDRFEKAHLYYGHGTDNAWDEAMALARAILRLGPDLKIDEIERTLALKEKEQLIQLVNTRINKHIPMPYLIQEVWFAHRKFYIDERALIPRSPFAELILKGFQPWLGKYPIRSILDLCTGSGCLAITCAYIFKEAQIDAVDISEEALAVAEKNIALHQCGDRVRLLHSDLYQACTEKQYDIIISNPPYVSAREMQTMPLEYQWEPKIALAAGKDGLQAVKAILHGAPEHLTEQGLLFIEVGNRAAALQKQYPQISFTWLEFEHGGEGVLLLAAQDKAQWAVF